jgi:hypothetical protein
VDKLYPSIFAILQLIENVTVKNEERQNGMLATKGCIQTRIVVQAQSRRNQKILTLDIALN